MLGSFLVDKQILSAHRFAYLKDICNLVQQSSTVGNYIQSTGLLSQSTFYNAFVLLFATFYLSTLFNIYKVSCQCLRANFRFCVKLTHPYFQMQT